MSFECDDASDCPEYTKCCVAAATRVGVTVCAPYDAVDDNSCGDKVCAQGGAPCTKGHTCQEGLCRPPSPARATCGTIRCPEATPICRWERGKGTCVSRAEGDALARAREAADDRNQLPVPLACTNPGDCGPRMSCCTTALGNTREYVGEAMCRHQCDQTSFIELCNHDTDCPMFMVLGANGGPQRQRCVKDATKAKAASLPLSTGRCELPVVP